MTKPFEVRRSMIIAGISTMVAVAAFASLIYVTLRSNPVCAGATAAAAMDRQDAARQFAILTLVAGVPAVLS